ncbi:hypothetical protein PFNF54_00815 [Plasmodium falciparum NF54]|uniref:Uncharacterized protein n=1 Tax=Plasmodium falciparum (isolate NF54) TaxID=5843 RepID=W7KBH8_PLAFO|nr:hypothetical protein PFNF54_00815 [Plasmodium falciparum NF54]
MKQKLGNIYKTKFQHIVQNPKKFQNLYILS